MKKLILVLLVLVSISFAITVSEKTGIVILPAKVGNGWNMDEADYLISLLEEKALSLGRFRVYSRNDLDAIVKERNLSELGIVEKTFEAGKILGAKYAILLTLTELTSQYEDNGYTASLRLSLKLYDLSSGELLAAKTFDDSTYVEEETAQKAINSLLELVSEKIWLTLREFFKVEAYVKSVEDGKVYLAGLEPNIVKKGFIFKIETSDGDVAYVEVIGIDRKENLVVTKFKYGGTPEVFDPAIEYPISGTYGGFSIGMYSGKISIGISGFQNNLFVDAGIILASEMGYVPWYTTVGGLLKFAEMGQISLSGFGGLQLLGIYNTNSDSNDSFLNVFGINAGVQIKYEFEPKNGIFINAGYTMLFLGDVVQNIYNILFGIDNTSFVQFNIGYFMAF
ncbi:hypothetical protein SU69_02330 [Thermosipho melanesiensis]|uniref:Curli production assembly/transport component CsgG n=2 Tax=Thermosipho melanesiensis TaxID=46541 RepID=A6LK65_THEM4|nr:CsgG/HfaB family protein [Thermosipho melanesiensis]ABR30316.1 hypothetical protein Tmel_0449 [Thermosipho melanesiensis BI429]APT73485.1 hypothetical protein BW47_02435 [Thermosipho melanesiensis]OOC37437.1 hypothetical protein SU68_02340 [Thermosipho melanesiensis]OOC39799.1 hypothetical protein SU69_02330 [Thermosipho melanesiensis]OOC39904.1 hypothetical protein SU70_02325 [Thermosipho melanesiensis]